MADVFVLGRKNIKKPLSQLYPSGWFI